MQCLPNAIVNHEGQDYIFIVTDAHSEEEHHNETETAEHKHDESGHQHSEKKNQTQRKKEQPLKKSPSKGTTDVVTAEITLLKEIPKQQNSCEWYIFHFG